MTHQPPIPKEATSPYPIQSPPIPEAVKQRIDESDAEREAEAAAGPSRGTVIGVGAAIAVGAAAAVGGLIYAKRRSPPAKKRAKGKQAKSRKASKTRH